MSLKDDRNKRRPSVSGKRVVARPAKPRHARVEDPEQTEVLLPVSNDAGVTQRLERVDALPDGSRHKSVQDKSEEVEGESILGSIDLPEGVAGQDLPSASSSAVESPAAPIATSPDSDEDAEGTRVVESQEEPEPDPSDTEEGQPRRALTTSEALMLFASASAKEVPAKRSERLRGREAVVAKPEPDPSPKTQDENAPSSDGEDFASDAAGISAEETVLIAPIGSSEGEDAAAGLPQEEAASLLADDATVAKGRSVPASSSRPSVRGKAFVSARRPQASNTDAASVSDDAATGGQGASAGEGVRPARIIPEAAGKKSSLFKSTKSKVICALAVLIAIAALVACIAWVSFNGNVDRSIAVRGDSLERQLVPVAEKEDPYYALFVVEYNRTSRYYTGPETIALLRVDPASDTVTVISIPSSTEVPLSDGEYHAISEAEVLGGDAYMVQTVSELLDVDIAHYLRTDDIGLQRIVDQFGGITVDVAERVEDADAGEGSIEAGNQTIDGAQTVLLTRADAFSDPVPTRCANQIGVLCALLDKAIDAAQSDYLSSIDALKGDFKTDMTGSQLRSCLTALAGNGSRTTYSAMLPGEVDEEGSGVFYRDKAKTRLMMDSVSESGNPEVDDEGVIYKASIFIEVQNGTEIEGGASQLRQKLRDCGWNVSFIGNNEDVDTPETLVIYDDEAYADAAEEIVSDLGLGRAMRNDEGAYQFGTDLLVILGQDWESAS